MTTSPPKTKMHRQAGRRRAPGRPVDGILLIDKPTGITSNGALQQVKRWFGAKKAGHTGSLDPLASGLLPLCFGRATKFSQYLLDADKSYEVTAKLGVQTETSDAEGAVVKTRPIPALTPELIDATFEPFRGKIQQVPSMYSALKYQGKPLYAWAREGVTVPRDARPLTIYDLRVTAITEETVSFMVSCSKGTYVRTLVDDFGEALGCGAHVIALRRTRVAGYDQAQMVNYESLESLPRETLDALLLPIDSAFLHYESIILSEAAAFQLRQGNVVDGVGAGFAPCLPDVIEDNVFVRLYAPGKRFVGLGELAADSKLYPKKLLC